MVKKTPSSRSDLTNDKPQVAQRHPPEAQQDLIPEQPAGQTLGATWASEEHSVRYASEIKELMRQLDGFTLRELQQIPVLAEGARLQQGKTYMDLHDPTRRTFAASGEAVAQRGQWLVPKTAVPCQYWHRLHGTEPPERHS